VEVTLTQEEVEHANAVALENGPMVDAHVDRFASRDERREVGRRLDPSTAQLFFSYGEVDDPYGEYDPAHDESCIGRQWFAVDPIARVAVHLSDLSEEMRTLLDPKRREADAAGWRRLLSIEIG
jgi:hypothetical protein